MGERTAQHIFDSIGSEPDECMNPREGDHVLGIRFMQWRSKNWMMTAWIRDGLEMGATRFRVFGDNRAWGSDDRCRWIFIDMGPVEGANARAEVVAKLHLAAGELANSFPPHFGDFVEVDGGVEKMVKALVDVSWAHVHEVPE